MVREDVQETRRRDNCVWPPSYHVHPRSEANGSFFLPPRGWIGWAGPGRGQWRGVGGQWRGASAEGSGFRSQKSGRRPAPFRSVPHYLKSPASAEVPADNRHGIHAVVRRPKRLFSPHPPSSASGGGRRMGRTRGDECNDTHRSIGGLLSSVPPGRSIDQRRGSRMGISLP